MQMPQTPIDPFQKLCYIDPHALNMAGQIAEPVCVIQVNYEKVSIHESCKTDTMW